MNDYDHDEIEAAIADLESATEHIQEAYGQEGVQFSESIQETMGVMERTLDGEDIETALFAYLSEKMYGEQLPGEEFSQRFQQDISESMEEVQTMFGDPLESDAESADE